MKRGYAATLAVALFALTPYIISTSASGLLGDQVGNATGLSANAAALASAVSTGLYAFGALLAGDLVNRLRKRHMCLALQAALVVGWGLMALASSGWIYAAGQVLAGFATGMLLVVALPPTVQQYPAHYVPFTAIFINIGLFGGVAAGPLVGGLIASVDGAWRWLFGGFALLAAANLFAASRVLPDDEPMNPQLKQDRSALMLGLLAALLPFAAVGALGYGGFGSALFLAPLLLGLIAFAALLVVEYVRKHPLAPVHRMSTTYPIVGTIVATIGGGAFVTLLDLSILALRQRGPAETGLLFAPQLLGAICAAVLLGALFKTRYLPVLVAGGMILLLGATALLHGAGTHVGTWQMLGVTALLGFGAGSTVAPGLFLAGMSLPSRVLGRIIALIELVRSVGDFLFAPVMRHLAGEQGQRLGLAIDITGLGVIGALILAIAIYLAGSNHLPKPELKKWLEGDEEDEHTAIESPPLFARLRKTQA